MIEYLCNYKSRIDIGGDWGAQRWDLFISAYNDSERVRTLFERFPADTKKWVLLPEYSYQAEEIPDEGDPFIATQFQEDDLIINLFDSLDFELADCNLCIDITGFMRPHILFLVRYLDSLGIKKFDVVYSEPKQYQKREETKFSSGDVSIVRQVSGFEGTHISDMSRDLLIVGAGYDHDLVSRVAENKDVARLVKIYGLPSLSPDMYQESILRLRKAAESFSGKDFDRPVYFSSANDPFVTAAVLQKIVKDADAHPGGVSNFYFSPLSTKPQTLGFAIFFIREMLSRPASVIFPFSSSYSRETSQGIGKVWSYAIDLT